MTKVTVRLVVICSVTDGAKHSIWACSQTSWPLFPSTPLLTSPIPPFLFPSSFPPSLSLCPNSLTYLLPHSLLPSLPLFLPASCCSGPPGPYSPPSDKRIDRTTKKKKTNDSYELLCSLYHSVAHHYLVLVYFSLSLSLSLSLLSVLSLRESSWSLVSQSRLTVTQTVLSAQLELQWPAF